MPCCCLSSTTPSATQGASAARAGPPSLAAGRDGIGVSYELVFVDDGSTDGTFARVERIHAADGHVRAVRLKRNFGQHPAMHAGLVRGRGDVLLTMDGDLQNAPEDIPKLY